jgi:hypothetical protein
LWLSGSFECRNRRCRTSGWSSKLIAITLRMYPGEKYNARVYYQRCRACNELSEPKLDDSYAKRVAYRLKKWCGVQMEAPQYSKLHTRVIFVKDVSTGIAKARAIRRCPGTLCSIQFVELNRHVYKAGKKECAATAVGQSYSNLLYHSPYLGNLYRVSHPAQDTSIFDHVCFSAPAAYLPQIQDSSAFEPVRLYSRRRPLLLAQHSSACGRICMFFSLWLRFSQPDSLALVQDPHSS